jgi:copper oxidase (laccase) domain-containing protein
MASDLLKHIIFLTGFPAKAGITTIPAGDYGFSQVKFDFKHGGCEMTRSNLLTNRLGGSFHHKILPEHKDKIHLASGCGNYQYGDGIISYREKDNSEVLYSITADYPTIVMTACGKKLIAIIHSGWRGTELNIAGKAIAIIKEKFNITAGEINAGIFSGICANHYCVGKEVGGKFPGFFDPASGKLDLRGAIKARLSEAGILEEKMTILDVCSFHSTNDSGEPLFFSVRREAIEKRNAVFITRN